MKKAITRIINIERYLGCLKPNEKFHFGLFYDEYIKSDKLDIYGLPKTFDSDLSIVPLPEGSTTKKNKNGILIRQQPEEKITIKKHIHYIRQRDRKSVEYDREYTVFKKVLAYNYNSPFYFCTNLHNQEVVISELLIFDKTPESNEKIKHIINMFIEIFNTFEILTEKLEYAVAWTENYNDELLRKGTIANIKDYDELIEYVRTETKSEKETQAFHERIQVLKNYNPDILGRGAKGFSGYIVFGFSKRNYIILESMYYSNATYIFDIKDYATHIIKDKQTILSEKLAIKKINHTSKWETEIAQFLTDIKNV